MSCPICGANCKCRNRGSDGMCCSCHRHKPSRRMKADFLILLDGVEPSEVHKKITELHKLKSQPDQMALGVN